MRIEELPASPANPELVQTEARDIRGLDLLGLRSPAEAVAVGLLDGVTTITPNVRYFGLRSWIILRYLKLGGLKDWRSFTTFAAKVEAAVALASALCKDTTGGVIGRERATSTVQKTDGPLPLTRLTKILAVSVYAGSSESLGLGSTQGGIPGLTKERGLLLAQAFDRQVSNDDVLYAVTLGDDGQTFSRHRLASLGTRLTMAPPIGEERELILKAIFPPSPRRRELPRIASYCLLLHACEKLGGEVDEADIFQIAAARNLDGIPEELHLICDGWTRFVIRDLLVLVHEAAVNLVLAELMQSAGSEKRRPLREVIAACVGENLDECLDEFLDRLADPSFATKCSARQLQQATVFPLAVSKFASRGPWVTETELAAFAQTIQRTCEILLSRNKWEPDQNTGEARKRIPLIEEIRSRYVSEGRGDDFDQIIGDGTLWLVLMGSLTVLSGDPSRLFARNLILRDVARYPALFARIVPELLAPLARRIKSDADADPLDRAKRVVHAFDNLEGFLRPRVDNLKANGASGAKVDDWLWNTGVGFAQILELGEDGKAKVHVPKKAETLNSVLLSFYVNLRILAEQDFNFRRLLAACAAT
jgi:hypothetical protein